MPISRKLSAACSAVALVSNVAFAQPATPTAPAGVVTGTSVQSAGPNGTTINQTFQSGPALTQAEAQAQSAQISAFNSAFSSSAITPGVTGGTNEGIEEGNLLAAVAINAAANEIMHLTALQNRALFIYPGNTGFDLSAYTTFDLKLKSLIAEFSGDKGYEGDNKRYEDAVNAAMDAIKAAQAKAKPKARSNLEFRTASFVGGAEIFGEGLGAAAKILSYFATSYNAAGVTVSTTDYMLAIAIANRDLNHAVIYNQMLAIGAQKAIQAKLAPLAQAVATAETHVTKGNPLTDAQKKIVGTKLSGDIDDAVTALKSDVSDYSAFAVSLFGGMQGANAVTGNIGTIVQEHVAYSALQQGAGLLYVQIHNASGGLMSKTNLWSTLGAMPLYASGSVVVSYALYAKGTPPTDNDATAKILADVLKTITTDQDTDYYPLVAGGLFGVTMPYHTIGHVPQIVLLDKQGICDQFNQKILPQSSGGDWPADTTDDTKTDAGKYCPR